MSSGDLHTKMCNTMQQNHELQISTSNSTSAVGYKRKISNLWNVSSLWICRTEEYYYRKLHDNTVSHKSKFLIHIFNHRRKLKNLFKDYPSETYTQKCTLHCNKIMNFEYRHRIRYPYSPINGKFLIIQM